MTREEMLYNFVHTLIIAGIFAAGWVAGYLAGSAWKRRQ